MQALEVNETSRQKLKEKLLQQEEIFSFKKEPLLASLTACLGIQNEIGRKNQDRLSPYLGIDLENDNPWQSEIVTYQGEIGLRLFLKEGGNLLPQSQDLAYVLHPLSFDKESELSQIVIFPKLIFKNYLQKKFELVIVRDWAVSAFLYDNEEQVNYLYDNDWEIKNNAALVQSKLVLNRQIAFSGTHDLADHLLGANAEKYSQPQEIYQRVAKVFGEKFCSGREALNQELVLSYGIGFLLDDLAQPRWYNSTQHLTLLNLFIEALAKIKCHSYIPLKLPASFSRMMHLLRTNQEQFEKSCSMLFQQFLVEIA